MAVREWRIEAPVQHELRLQHGWASGRVQLFIDEQLIYERSVTPYDLGFSHQFSVDGITHVVAARSRGVGFAYSLDQTEIVERGIMGLFFSRYGLRRQMGCITLLAALLLTCEWLRSLRAGSSEVDMILPRSLAIPLTLLSAFLILWTPRHRR